MTIAESILPEFEQEMASTRRVLERVPDDKLNWKPHPRSNTIGWVASHLVEIAGWVEGTLRETVFDFNPVGGVPYRTPMLGGRSEMLDTFDKHVAAAKAAIASTPDSEFFVNWSLCDAGKPLFTLPRIAVVRTWMINHAIHHRAVLCVYLRLNDIPVPGMYGPSGDE